MAATIMIVGGTGRPVEATPTTPADVYATLGVDRVPGDYVVMVDVSGSIDGARYAQLKRSLTAFLAALAPDDQVTLVPFADTARAKTQAAGRAPGRLLATLPAAATGKHTDIGAAIEKSIDVLRRPGAPALATVVLLTDGAHDPPAGSPYPFTQGYQWDQLAKSARTLPQKSVVAYAIPLAGTTGAPLLKKVFPTARVLEPASIDRLTAALEQPKIAARAAKARSILIGDATQGVRVSWPARTIGAGHTDLAVTLTSTMAHVPLTLDRLVVSTDNPDVTVRAPSTPVTLPPAATVTVPVTVDWHAGPRQVAPLSTVRGNAGLTLTADIGSPWSDVITSDLRIPFQPALTGATSAQSLSAQRGSIGYWIAGAVMLLLLVALWWRWRARRLSPDVFGTLVVRTASGNERRIPLAGRKTRLTAGTSGLTGVGEVTATRATVGAARTDLMIGYSPDGSVAGRVVVTCEPGTTVEAGGVTFTWDDGASPARGRPASSSRAVAP